MSAQDETLADDLLHGAKKIADFLGIEERQARWQIDKGNIRVTRMGRLIVGSKIALRRQFAPEGYGRMNAERDGVKQHDQTAV
jgi:hypothetical protein